jgi:hypothetical protein
MSRKRSRRRRTGPKKVPGDATSSKASFATWAKDERSETDITRRNEHISSGSLQALSQLKRIN